MDIGPRKPPSAILCNPVGCKVRGQAGVSYNLTKHSLLLPAPTMSYSSWYPEKTHLLHLTRLSVERRNFLGLFLWCLLTSSGGGGAVHRCQLSCHSSGGEGEKIGNPSQKISTNQTECFGRMTTHWGVCLCFSYFGASVHLWVSWGSFSAVATKLRSLLGAQLAQLACQLTAETHRSFITQLKQHSS